MKFSFLINKFTVLIVAIFMELKEIFSHKCIHNKLNKTLTKNNATQPEIPDLRFLQSKDWTPIEIYIDYTYMDSQKQISKEFISFAKNVINVTVNIYSTLLSVQRINPLVLLSENCGDITLDKINGLITNQGIKTDLVIIPFFDDKQDDLTEAYAAPCTTDPTTNRPVTGYFAFNSNNFIINQKNSLEYYTMLVLHELNHILSFSDSLFNYYVDSSFTFLDANKLMTKINMNDVERQVIITPKVVEAARKHFGCKDLIGVELEDQGGSGTAASHWETRVMLGDFMIGESYPENVISEITLALFEDSGWYKVNYYTGGLFRFGKNKGCDFIMKKCIHNQTSDFSNDFCTVKGAEMCFSSRLNKGFCSINKHGDIPKSYQYFSDVGIGGFHNADYCPVADWEFDKSLNMFFSSNCAYGVSKYQNLGEIIGDNSYCFMSSLIPKNIISFNDLKGKNRAICYQTNCNEKDQTYSVNMLNYTLVCSKAGGILTVDGLDGQFFCPDYNYICTKTAPCKDAKECVLNKVTYDFPKYDYVIDKSYISPLNDILSDDLTGFKSNNAEYYNQFLKNIIAIFIFLFFYVELF